MAGSFCTCSAYRQRCVRHFLGDREIDMPRLDSGTLYEPYATSLRMSDLGYRNKNQAGVNISVNQPG